MSVTQLKDGRWICQYTKGKDPSRPSTNKKYFGRNGEQEAIEFNVSLGLGRKKTVSSPLFSELATAYLDARKSSITESTFDTMCSKLDRTVLPLLGNLMAHKVNANQLDKYVYIRKQSVKLTTIHRELSDIRAILNWAVKRKLISSNPMSGLDMPKRDDSLITPPSEAEFNAILTCAVPHIKRAMLITRYTGLRPGRELFSLTWGSYDHVNRTLTIVSAKKGGVPLRMVPLSSTIYTYMSQWCDEDGAHGYIISYNGKSVCAIDNGWIAAKRRAGIKRKLPLYSLRHMFVTQLLEKGADVKTVSELAGSTPAIIMKWYQFVSTDLKRRTIDLLN